MTTISIHKASECSGQLTLRVAWGEVRRERVREE